MRIGENQILCRQRLGKWRFVDLDRTPPMNARGSRTIRRRRRIRPGQDSQEPGREARRPLQVRSEITSRRVRTRDG